MLKHKIAPTSGDRYLNARTHIPSELMTWHEIIKTLKASHDIKYLRVARQISIHGFVCLIIVQYNVNSEFASERIRIAHYDLSKLDK